MFTIRKVSWLFGFFCSLSIYSVSAGPDPCSSTPLANNMASFQTYSNIGFGDSGIADPGCADYSGPDIWFEIIVPATGMLYVVLQEDVMINSGAALYDGTCTNPNLITCVESDFCGSDMPIIDVEDLVPGSTVWLRVWAENGSPDGDFGVLVMETPAISPDFNTVGNSFYVDDDCIQLTSNGQNQIGCAWFPELIDFSLPFSHSMLMNFGSSNSGADGMCLVYQNFSGTACGGGGGNIGAQGILNSFIVEFDTYQNSGPPYNDPFDDHSGIQVNGSMDHTTGIDGPVTLGSGNIEDGMYHDVMFNWDPATMSYEVWFDGDLIMSGMYDIVTNCFGGVPLAFWGFTGSTGAETNVQTVCPGGIDFDHGFKTIVNAEICYGEFYFAGGFNQSQPGVYYDEVPLTNGCFELIETHLEVNPVYDIYMEETICFGECIDIGPNSYCESGDYEVTLSTVHTNCDSTIQLNLTVVDVLALVEEPDAITCINNTIFLDASNSVPGPGTGVTYSWTGPNNFSSTDYAPEVSESGYYYLVVILEVNGIICESEAFEVEVALDNDNPTAIAGQDLILDCATSVVYADGSGSSVGSNYTYQWDGPNGYTADSLNAAFTQVGSYTLYVFNTDNGCFSTDELNVVMDGSTLMIEIQEDTLTCLQDSLTLIVNSSSNLSLFQWTGPNGFVSDSSAPLIFNPGEYLVTVTDINGCEGQSSQTIIGDFNSPNALSMGDTLTCNDNSIILSGSSDSTNVNYFWSGPNGFTIDSQHAVVSVPGIYELVVTGENGCSSSLEVEVYSDGQLPVISSIPDTVLTCSLDGIFLSGTSDQPGSEFMWTGPNNFQSDDPNPYVDTIGTYTLIVTSTNGCEAVIEVNISGDYLSPQATYTFDSLNCLSPQGLIDIQPNENNYSYEWTGPNSFTASTEDVQVQDAGNYVLILTAENDCKDTLSFFIPIDTLSPSVSLEVDTLTCELDSVQINLIGGNTSYSYSWIGPDNFMSTIAQPYVQNGGAYNLTVLAENGCTQDLGITVEIDDNIPFVELEADDITCEEKDFHIYATSSTSNLEYTWTGPLGFTSDEMNPLITQAGTYDLVISAQNGCQENYTIEVFADQMVPFVSLSADTLDCSTLEVNLIISGYDPSYQLNWTGPGSFNSTEISPSVSTPGLYTLISQSNNFCKDTSEIEVMQEDDVPQILSISALDAKCGLNNGQIIGIESIGGVPPFEYSIDGGIIFQSEPVFSDLAPGNYEVIIQDINGCNSTAFLDLEGGDIPDLNLSPYIELNFGEEFQFNPTVNIPDSLIDSIYWTPANDLSCQNCLYPILTAFENENYEITLIDIFGCETSANISVQLIRQFDLFIPNTFTPNRDGKNDRFTIYGDPAVIAEVEYLYIYDRWGELVWSGEHFDIGNDQIGWDGSFKGRTLNPGVFIYTCAIKLHSGITESYTGDITLIY